MTLHERLARDVERRGLLEVQLSATRSDATVVSEDGNRTVAWLSPSGAIAGLLVQDFACGEDRRIPFPFGEIEIVSEGNEIAIFLRPRG